MVSVVVVFTIVKVKVACGVWVLTHSIGVDLEFDRVLDGMEERFAVMLKVKDGKDRSTSNESALLRIGNVHDVDIVVAVYLKLGVDVVPLGCGWQVHLNLGCRTSNRVLNARVANLGADENIRSKHELMVEIVGHLILGVLVPHGTNDGQTSVGGLEEQVVQVVTLSVSLLDGSESGALNAG